MHDDAVLRTGKLGESDIAKKEAGYISEFLRKEWQGLWGHSGNQGSKH